MRYLSKVDLETLELANALEFTVSREDGLLETLGIPIFALIVLWYFWRTGTLWLRIIAGAAAFATVFISTANRVQGGKTRLRVTREEFLAEGNLGRLFTTTIKIPTSNVSAIRFDDGGDGGISGLYVRHGWRNTPVLPRLNREQTRNVIEAIRTKFPEIPVKGLDR
jgi:hypothetical protein